MHQRSAIDDVGNLDTVTYPNGLLTDYDYNAVNQLTDVLTRDAINTVINHFNYSLTLTGRREIITELDGRTTAYCYDDLYRLTDEVVYETTPATPPLTGCITDTTGADYVANYEYDWVGNRTYETVDGVSTAYAYDLNDRLTSTGGTVYIYDDNGNTITETLDGVVKTYTWDGKNKLINFDNAGSTTAYTYNHNGIRDSKTEGAINTQFIVDENRDYAQVLEEVENGSATVSYTYGHDLVNQERSGTINWYHYDGLGSTRLLSDGLGAFSDTYDYEAFGEVLNETGTTENSYKYTGEQYDASLEQIYLRARYYDQSVGRFTQQVVWQGVNAQPITLNKYLYANADPANGIDPSGYLTLRQLGTALETTATLATVGLTSYDITSGLVSGEGASLSQAGMIALSSLGGIKLFKLMGKKALKKWNCGKPNERKICDIFLPDAERIDKIRTSFRVGKRRNVAFADYITSDGIGSLVASSGQHSPTGTASMPQNTIYQTGFVGHSRALDSEVKLYENMSAMFGPGTKGLVRLVSELDICASCNRVGHLFRGNHPSITLMTKGGVKPRKRK